MKFLKPALIAAFLLSTSANAALHVRLGGQAIYDDVADLTWLQDANYAVTSGDDYSFTSTFSTNGGMIVSEGMTWAAGLNIAGVTGWRLPSAPDVDPTCDQFYYNCTGSELGNLFYNVLGGVAEEYIHTTHNANYDLFSNIQGLYWATPNAVFFMEGAQLGDDPAIHKYLIWPVQTGDVALKLLDNDADGHIANDDCDDNNASVYPGATEINNDGIDANCDGTDNRTDIGLHTRLSGSVVYEADRDISWLGNMNLAATQTFGVAGIEADGRMTWDTANLWIAAMNQNYYLGFNDWRLPEALNPMPDPLCNGDANCDAGDMGHLYYQEFNYTQGDEVNSGGLPGCTLCTPHSDVSLFSTFESTYWTDSLRDVSGVIYSDEFHFNGINAGSIIENNATALNHVTAIRSGHTSNMIMTQQQATLNGSNFSGLGNFVNSNTSALITPDSVTGTASSSLSGSISFNISESGWFVYRHNGDKTTTSDYYDAGYADISSILNCSYLAADNCKGAPILIYMNPGQYNIYFASSTAYDGYWDFYLNGRISISLKHVTDKDGDGYFGFDGNYSNLDCNDNDAAINPGATDILYDGIDQDCNGSDAVDIDGDGFTNAVDCNDNNANIYPGAPETDNDRIDSNCDGLDNIDADADGYTAVHQNSRLADCNDNDPSIYPNAIETRNDGIDSNCDGHDNTDGDRDGFDRYEDCNDTNPNQYPGAPETNNDGIDSNCDGLDDNIDADADADGFDSNADCNDNDANIYPGATEVISDGIDQSCNGYDLTISIISAVYSSKRKTLIIEASSALGKSAKLVLDGYGSMNYTKRKDVWSIKVRKVIAQPTSVTVSGIEGSVNAVVTVQ